MTEHELKILDRINEYADNVLTGIDPQKVQISYQLEKLKPIMETIANEEKKSIEEIFIMYMDLASTASVEKQQKFQSTMSETNSYGDMHFDIQN